MKRAVTTVAALVAAQALMVGAWLAVERARAPADAGGQEGPAEAGDVVAARRTTPMSRPAPAVTLRDARGRVLRLAEVRGGEPLLLHVWATWCPPCREELPGLLAYAAEGDVPVAAVALDAEWEAVRRFVGAGGGASILLADAGEVERALGVRRLPVTFLVDAEGVLRLRLDGARDWGEAAVREQVRAAVSRDAPGEPTAPPRAER